jgi:hypothetical protein
MSVFRQCFLRVVSGYWLDQIRSRKLHGFEFRNGLHSQVFPGFSQPAPGPWGRGPGTWRHVIRHSCYGAWLTRCVAKCGDFYFVSFVGRNNLLYLYCVYINSLFIHCRRSWRGKSDNWLRNDQMKIEYRHWKEHGRPWTVDYHSGWH